MLTKKQLELLEFLEKKIATSGFSPSFEEMKHALGLRSKSGIHRLICGLEERGFLRKLAHRARSIEILRTHSSIIRNENKKNNYNQNKSSESKISTEQIRSIPKVGKIAAGSPIEALNNSNDMIEIPESLLGSGNYFALNVTGDSMINIGIYDGDLAIIEQKNEAKDGDIVVALINEMDATLKRFKKTNGKIVLEAENENYPSQVYGKNKQIRIQGILSGIIRKYN